MPSDRPQTRFLLRGSALLVALLGFWWFVLLNPLLLLLRTSSGMFWGIFVDDSGKFISETAPGVWSLHVPMQFTAPPSPQQPAPVEVHSVDFDVARTDAIAFTFSLPVYWAIVLAATDLRRNLRPLALGTMLVVVLEALLFLAFAEISAHHVAAQWSNQKADPSDWFLRFGYYLVVNVIPYVAPFLIALGLHREFSGQVFRGSHSKTVVVPSHRSRTDSRPLWNRAAK
jgi:hypothetical protein